MSSITQPLREEHKELLPHIESLRETADAVGSLPYSQLRARLEAAHSFLVHHLIPHATAEDNALYPAVAALMKAPRSTATMSRDHVEVGRLTHALATILSNVTASAPADADEKELRRILYGLHALIKVHFAKEEEIYLPLLDEHMGAEEAHAMFAAMENAAAQAKATT